MYEYQLNKMNDDHFENLARQHPDLFQKSNNFEFSIGVGWYTIIDTLCSLISYRVENAKAQLKHALENPEWEFVRSIEELELEVTAALEELPAITQVKEKFGTLRVYVSNSTPTVSSYIDFAEEMSQHMCESCGKPGKSRPGYWIKVLCNECHKTHDIDTN